MDRLGGVGAAGAAGAAAGAGAAGAGTGAAVWARAESDHAVIALMPSARSFLFMLGIVDQGNRWPLAIDSGTAGESSGGREPGKQHFCQL
jgi:hypothetical protein